jgi:hypothetical protein
MEVNDEVVLYVREIARINGKPKDISQIYTGSPERIAGFTRGTDTDCFHGRQRGVASLLHKSRALIRGYPNKNGIM